MSNLDVRAQAITTGISLTLRPPAVTFSQPDLEKLGKKVGDNTHGVFPTSALCSLHQVGVLSHPTCYASALKIAETACRGTTLSKERLEAVFDALNTLSKLDEPLARVAKYGDLTNQTWVITPKGQMVARLIKNSTQGMEAPLIEQRDTSFRVLLRALGATSTVDSLEMPSLPPLPSAAK